MKCTVVIITHPHPFQIIIEENDKGGLRAVFFFLAEITESSLFRRTELF